MEMVDIVTFSDGVSWADHTDSDDVQWTTNLWPDGMVKLSIDDVPYYTRT